MGVSIAVALCTHNGAQFVEEQLRSILDQTTPPQQIVISDDASTDDTVELARAMVSGRAAEPGHPPIEIIVLRNPEALGVARNFEAAILATSSDLVALSDQDDIWRPDRLAMALPEFESRPHLDLLFSNARLVDAAGASIDRTLFDVLEISDADQQLLHEGGAMSLFIKRNFATGATVMFRRRLLERALPFPPNWVHDEWLGVMAAATGQVDVIDETLIDYRQHGANVIGVDFPTLRRKVERALEPRGGRNERLSLQFEQFASRLESVEGLAPAEVVVLARDKAIFEAERNDLPSSRLRRIRRIIAANRRDGYSRFASQGRLDIVRDLLQPIGPRSSACDSANSPAP